MMNTQKQSVNYPERVRNELCFRESDVVRCEDLCASFRRIVLTGKALEGFSSCGFDDHTKIFFLQNGESIAAPQVTENGIVWPGDIRPQARDYTPLFNAQRQELAFDFYLHDGGVASQWAQQAKPGDKLTIGGPRGSLVVPLDYHWQLYVCDETGLPALRRRLEEIHASGEKPQIKALVSVHSEASKDYLQGVNNAEIEWLVAEDESVLAERLTQITVPQEDYFVWITGEGKTVKRLSAPYEGVLDPQLLRAVAYWHSKAE